MSKTLENIPIFSKVKPTLQDNPIIKKEIPQSIFTTSELIDKIKTDEINYFLKIEQEKFVGAFTDLIKELYNKKLFEEESNKQTPEIKNGKLTKIKNYVLLVSTLVLLNTSGTYADDVSASPICKKGSTYYLGLGAINTRSPKLTVIIKDLEDYQKWNDIMPDFFKKTKRMKKRNLNAFKSNLDTLHKAFNNARDTIMRHFKKDKKTAEKLLIDCLMEKDVYIVNDENYKSLQPKIKKIEIKK